MDPKFPPDEHEEEGEYPADADEEQENKRIAWHTLKARQYITRR
jgi:hypothetical protein